MITGIVAQQALIAAAAPGGIQFVGYKTNKFSEGSPTFDFSGLTGGAAQDGDFFLAWATECASTAGVPGYSAPPGGLGNILNNRQNDSRDNASRLDYGFIVDASSDSGQWFTGQTRTRMTHILVFRGVNATTPLDVTPGTNSQANNNLPHPPPITPVTDGSLIVTIGSGTAPVGPINFADPMDGSNALLKDNYEHGTLGRIISMSTSKPWATGDGSFTPDFYTGVGFRTDGARQAATLALRPA